MRVIPVGKKISVKLEKANKKMVGDKEIEIVSSDRKYTRIIVNELGPDVEIDIAPGFELRLFSNAHINIHNEDLNNGLIDESDVWGIIQR
jgi:hypothetical protein